MKKATTLAAFASILTFSLLTNAGDRKAFHGAVCRCFQNTTFDTDCDDSDLEHAPSGTKIIGVGEHQLTCPLIRDRMDSESSISGIYVEYFNSGTDTVTIVAFTQEEDTSGASFDFDVLADSTSGNRGLGPLAPDTYDGNEGSYSVFATMGQNDILYHVYVNENDSSSTE